MKKYPSLINHYNNKDIEYVKQYVDFRDELGWIITEKIHGACISFKFQRDNVKVFSRNQEVDENFYGANKIINEMKNKLAELDMDDEYILFGELYGAGIQKGVNYGNEKRIAFFDCYVNGELETQKDFIHFTDYFKLPTVPIIGVRLSFKDAMETTTLFNSYLTPETFEGDNICEGIVIKPYDVTLVSNRGSVFYIKKKNEKFTEKQNTKTPKVVSSEVDKWNNEFKSYIHHERLQSVFSKYGEIENSKQISDYIRYVLDDAKETFYKEESEFDESKFDKKELKDIFNVGSMIVELIKQHWSN